MRQTGRNTVDTRRQHHAVSFNYVDIARKSLYYENVYIMEKW